MQAFITKGCFTNHGGRILEGDDSWIVEGKGVHLEGMTHYCPKCKVLSKAIATERGFMQINGKNPIVAGDVSTCGAKYMKMSDLAVRGGGPGSANNSSPVRGFSFSAIMHHNKMRFNLQIFIIYVKCSKFFWSLLCGILSKAFIV